MYRKQSIFVTRAHCHTYDCISVSNPVVDSQVIMFIEITGFNEIVLPEYLRQPPDNKTTLVLCLIRWLAPHPDARLRDADKRPVCPAPFDINHSLWRFARSHRLRAPFRPDVLDPQIHIFPGRNDTERRISRGRSTRRASCTYTSFFSRIRRFFDVYVHGFFHVERRKFDVYVQKTTYT